MSSVGTYLRDLRQRRGASLEEIARTTRVAQRYLECLEADDFEALPSPVFTRGFIRAYCQALNEPPEDALAAYEGREGRAPRPMGAARPVPASSRTVEAEPRGRSAVLVSFVLLVVLGVALFAVALVIHPRDRGDRITTDVRPEPRPEARQVRPPEPAPTTPAVRPTPPSAGIPGGVTGAPATAPSTPTPPRAEMPATPAPNAMVSAPSAPRPAPAIASTTRAASASPETPPAAPGASAPAPRSTPGAAAPPPAGTAPAPVASAPPAAPGTAAPPAAPGAVAPPVAAVPTPTVSGPALEAAIASVTSPYRLVARTNETTWIRVRTEDGRMSEENVPPGEVREWISNRPFVVTIGNAGGVTFELNGRTLPPLGAKGAVIQRIVLPPESR